MKHKPIDYDKLIVELRMFHHNSAADAIQKLRQELAAERDRPPFTIPVAE